MTAVTVARPSVLTPPTNAIIRLADRGRLGLLHALGPIARVLVRSRELRVAALGLSAVVFALGLTLSAPLALLALGPLLLGVPHLLADARYLVLRPGLHRRRVLLVPAAVLVLGLIAGLGVRAGLAAAILAALLSAAPLPRRLLVASVPGVLLFFAAQSPFAADVVFFHAHNLVAIGVWLAWRRRSGAVHVLVLAAFVGATLLLACAPLPVIAAAPHWTGLSFAALGETLSLSQSSSVSQRLVMFFAFSQSVHYAIWLRLIPDEDRTRHTPRTFAATVSALQRDVGATALRGCVLVGIALVALACFSISQARDAYLGIAYAHGHLELLAAAFLASDGWRRSSA